MYGRLLSAGLTRNPMRKISLMRILSSPTGHRTKHFIALFALLWWGGLNCLTGCLLMPSTAEAESACPMSGMGGDCCATMHGKDNSSEKSPRINAIGAPSTSSQSIPCCALESLTADKSRDVRAKYVTAIAILPSPINFISESPPRAELPGHCVRLPDRGGTYLLNCVFLI